MDRIQLLKSVVVFAALPDDVLPPLADCLTERRAAPGTTIFTEGQQADAFFIIERGEVAVTKTIGKDHEKVLSVLGPGSIFGEMAFFSDSPRTANALVRSDTVLWQIARKDFIQFVSHRPDTGLVILSALMQVAMQRLEETSRELATVYQTGNIISSGRQMNEIVGAVRDELLLALPAADNGAIFLYNEFNEEFDPVAAPESTATIGTCDPLIVTLKEKRAGMITAHTDEIRHLKEGLLRTARSALIVPVQRETVLLGILVYWNSQKENAFGSSHLHLAESVAGQLASAIENLRYQQEEQDRRRLNDAKQQNYGL